MNEIILTLTSLPAHELEKIKSDLQEIKGLLQAQQGRKPKEENGEFNKKYISREQMMKDFGVKSQSTPWVWESKGLLCPYKIGRSIYYLRSEVNNLIVKAR